MGEGVVEPSYVRVKLKIHIAGLLRPGSVRAGAIRDELAQALGGIAVRAGDRVVGLYLGEALRCAWRRPGSTGLAGIAVRRRWPRTPGPRRCRGWLGRSG